MQWVGLALGQRWDVEAQCAFASREGVFLEDFDLDGAVGGILEGEDGA